MFTEKQQQFRLKRKQHYNEASNIKLAKQLIEQELREAEEEEEKERREVKEAAGGTSAPQEGTDAPQAAPCVDGLSKKMEGATVDGTQSMQTGD